MLCCGGGEETSNPELRNSGQSEEHGWCMRNRRGCGEEEIRTRLCGGFEVLVERLSCLLYARHAVALPKRKMFRMPKSELCML